MSKAHIPAELRRQIRQDAGHRCGYRRASERITATELVVDHIQPESVGGPTARENLWLVCTRCNQFKGSKIRATDPQTGEVVPLQPTHPGMGGAFHLERGRDQNHWAYSSWSSDDRGFTSKP